MLLMFFSLFICVGGLFEKFPYLLPNFLAAIIIVLGIIATYFVIPETSKGYVIFIASAFHDSCKHPRILRKS